jgi:hypothetical protein
MCKVPSEVNDRNPQRQIATRRELSKERAGKLISRDYLIKTFQPPDYLSKDRTLFFPGDKSATVRGPD